MPASHQWRWYSNIPARNLFQLFDLLVGKQVFSGGLRGPLLRFATFGSQVCFIPAVVKSADPGLSF